MVNGRGFGGGGGGGGGGEERERYSGGMGIYTVEGGLQ